VERGYLAEVCESDHYIELMGLDTFTGAERMAGSEEPQPN
jgi:hypothetical protein